MAIKVGSGRAEVTISGSIADDLEAELRGLVGPVIDELQKAADRIMVEEIQAKWPEKTGKSLDGWATFLRVHPDSSLVEVVLSNPIKYTRYIKSTRIGWRADATRIRSPMTEQVRKPATKARRRLKVVLPQVLADYLTDELNDG
jgi:hypothetical protein